MLTTGFLHDGPSAVRYPRGHGPGVTPEKGLTALPLGKGELRRSGSRIALLAFGSLLEPALEAGDLLNATVANMRFVKPLDHALVKELALGHDLLVTLEENAVIGGAGAEVARSLEEQGLNTRLLRLGLPDRFTEHGDSAALLAQLGLDAKSIAERVKQAILE
jgi:1-deoxy-D-xylulose-5-phosphate synthase